MRLPLCGRGSRSTFEAGRAPTAPLHCWRGGAASYKGAGYEGEGWAAGGGQQEGERRGRQAESEENDRVVGSRHRGRHYQRDDATLSLHLHAISLVAYLAVVEPDRVREDHEQAVVEGAGRQPPPGPPHTPRNTAVRPRCAAVCGHGLMVQPDAAQLAVIRGVKEKLCGVCVCVHMSQPRPSCSRAVTSGTGSASRRSQSSGATCEVWPGFEALGCVRERVRVCRGEGMRQSMAEVEGSQGSYLPRVGARV